MVFNNICSWLGTHSRYFLEGPSDGDDDAL